MDSTGSSSRPNLVNTTRPSSARVYGWLLGSKDNFTADREAGQDMLDPGQGGHPGLRRLAQEHRRFVLRATGWAARRGVRQFLDLGCGLPLAPAVHDAARSVIPGAACAYVDKDPLIHSHVAALEARGPGLAAVLADVRDTGAVLGDPALKAVITLREPVAVILGGTLSNMSADEARDTVAGYQRATAPGSVVIACCAHFRDRELGKRIADVFSPDPEESRWRNHAPADVASFFGGLRIAGEEEGGVGEVADVRWWLRPRDADHAARAARGAARAASVIGGIGIRDLAASLANFDPRPHVLDMLAVFL